MTVDKIDGNRILIVLCSSDIEDFSLNYGKLSLNDKHSRRVILRIMRLACMKSGIDINNRSVLLEAVELNGEFYILITVKDKNPKKYRLKRGGCICYSLGSSGNFLDAVEHMYRQNVCCGRNSACVYNDEYYLIFDYPSIPVKLRRVLSEFDAQKRGVVYAAKVRENGKSICKLNAIESIGRHLV